MKTRGGGHSVQFTDVEVLKHSHSIQPPKSPRRKPHQQTGRPARRSNRIAGKAQPYTTAHQRMGSKASGQSGDVEGDIALSCSSSMSSISSMESSVEEQDWTDVETRVCWN